MVMHGVYEAVNYMHGYGVYEAVSYIASYIANISQKTETSYILLGSMVFTQIVSHAHTRTHTYVVMKLQFAPQRNAE